MSPRHSGASSRATSSVHRCSKRVRRTLHPRQRGAEAVVGAPSEAEGLVVGAGEVERLGVGEADGVAVRRTLEGEHRVARLEGDAEHLDWDHGDTRVHLYRAVPAEQLINEAGSDVGVPAPPFLLVRVLEQRPRPGPDQAGRHLVARREQQPGGRRDLVTGSAGRPSRARLRPPTAGLLRVGRSRARPRARR
jgi:hypothetical protein